MKRIVIHNHFARDREFDSQTKELHEKYLTARSHRLLFENAAHRGNVDDPEIILKNRERANKYRVEELQTLEAYNKRVQELMEKERQK